jgi:hypothetical protein
MAMGIVSPDEFDKELNNSKPKPVANTPSQPTIEAEIVDMPVPGRKEGDINVPDSLRQMIGATAFENGRSDALELGRQFGISPSAVSAYTHGSTSTASYDKTPNTSIIAKSRIRVQKRAMNRLMGALEHLTPEKLGEAKARDLAGIAKDMSAVIKTLEPEVLDNGRDKAPVPQFVVYAPQFRDERSYEVIHAKE